MSLYAFCASFLYTLSNPRSIELLTCEALAYTFNGEDKFASENNWPPPCWMFTSVGGGPFHHHCPFYLHVALSLLCGPFTPILGFSLWGSSPSEPPPPTEGESFRGGLRRLCLQMHESLTINHSSIFRMTDTMRHFSVQARRTQKNRRKSSQTTWYMSLFFRKQSVAAYYVEDGLECTLLILLQYPVERLPQSDVGCGRMLDASRHLWSIIIKLRFLLLARIAWPENDAKWCWIARYSQLIHGCSDIQCCTDATFWPCNLLKGGICYQDVCPSLCQVRPSQSWVTPKRFKISKFIGFAPHRKQYFYSSSHISQSWI